MKFYQIKFTTQLDLLNCEDCPYCRTKCPYEYAVADYYACCIKGRILVDYPDRPDWCPVGEIEE